MYDEIIFLFDEWLFLIEEWVTTVLENLIETNIQVEIYNQAVNFTRWNDISLTSVNLK